MANTIRLKRSAVPGKVPVVGDISLGELALNTYDGKLYTLKNDGVNAVVEIGASSAGNSLSSSTLSEQSGYFGNIYLKDDSNPSHYLEVTNSADLTAARTLSVNVNDASRSITLAGNLSLANNLTTSGNFALALTTTASTSVTLPTSGTLATLAGTEVFSNKSFSNALGIAAGAEALPSIAFTGDLSTGIYRYSTNIMGVSAGGVKAAYFGPTEQFNFGNIYITSTDDIPADAVTTTRDSGFLSLRGKYWNGTASANAQWSLINDVDGTGPTGILRFRWQGATKASLDEAGVFSATTFSGSGASLTSLNASNISSGTLPDARLTGTYTGVSITGSSASCTGNAATATTLATARTINGVSFNGSANINVPNLRDPNGAVLIDGTGVTSAVNYVTLTNAATAGAPTLSTAGTDTNIGLNITTKGTGSVSITTGGGNVALRPTAGSILFYDASNTYYTNLDNGSLTANRTLTMPNASVTLVGGTMVPTSGTGATGTWGIAITGNAATATNADNIERNGITAATNANHRLVLGPTHNTAGYGACYVVTDASRLYYNPSTDTLVGGTFSGSANQLAGKSLVDSAATINTVVGRNGSGDIFARLVRQDYADQQTISGGMVFRVNNTTDNYLRVCDDEAAIRTYLSVLALTGGTMTGALLSANGSELTPGVAFASDADTGIYRYSTNVMGVSAGGVKAAYFGPTEQFNFGNIYITSTDDTPADAVTTTRDSGFLSLRGKYWNGTASANAEWSLINDVDGTGPTGILRFRWQTATKASLDEAGVFTATTFSGALIGNASTASTATNADNIERNSITSATNANHRLVLGPTHNTAGYGACYVVTDASRLYYNPSTDTLVCGTLSGNATTATTATNATNVTLAAGSLTTNYVTFAEGTTGNRPIKTDTGLTYNASTNLLGASISGNAATATTLATARTIGGVSFNGSANINLPGVNTTGNQNTSGSSASCTGNAATVTNGVYANTNNSVGLTFGTSDTNPVVGNVSGVSITTGGLVSCNRDSQPSLFFGRRLDDGQVAAIYQAANQEGSINVSGTTVSYNAFLGSHWTRLTDNSKPEILVGTILETIDKLVEWKCIRFEVDGEQQIAPYYGSADFGETASIEYEGSTYAGIIETEGNGEGSVIDINKHVCVKVSDTLRSTAVYGVFVSWDVDPMEGMIGAWNDIICGSVGNYLIRMAPGEVPEIGSLFQSGGNGCAIVQDDDIVRSSTVGKVTSTLAQRTYDDGSFLVTCALYCG